ncbi:MAG: hypothetical protein R3B72_02310 [Polyangiaceae bacterium]
MAEPNNRIRTLFVASLAAVAFLLGWLLGRRDDAPSAAAPAPSASLRPEDVEVRVDADAVTLLPEGGLHLPPLPELDEQGQPILEPAQGGSQSP